MSLIRSSCSAILFADERNRSEYIFRVTLGFIDAPFTGGTGLRTGRQTAIMPECPIFGAVTRHGAGSLICILPLQTLASVASGY
jgi:hypothetical protein